VSCKPSAVYSNQPHTQFQHQRGAAT
jgi:hypothetical protein